MRRMLSLSIAIGLVLTAGAVAAQSRTVSTADMPKPGVSYISGPAVAVRKETVSTGTLPQPARLYVGGQVAVGGSDYQGHGDDGSYAGSGYYGGGYPPGYGWNDRDGRGGRDHDHGRPGHDHDHDGPGDGHGGWHDRDDRRDGSLSLAAGSGGNPSAGGAAGVRLAPERQPDRNDRRRDWNRGYYQNPPMQPGTGFTNNRAPQPGTGMGSGNQPGTGIPMRGNDGGWRGHGR
ncbi:hypothetical protein ACQKIE_14105 [Luteibacter sp. NPDC031894]|uniref:hypothetical protein n=1 Tax=Luteibacter sp. NPDC031894 TaxID=3390572 RepID=UPI003CFD76FC